MSSERLQTHLIIGPPGATGYTNANGSIAGNKPHNPFLNQTATFLLDVAGVAPSTTVTSATFSFYDRWQRSLRHNIGAGTKFLDDATGCGTGSWRGIGSQEAFAWISSGTFDSPRACVGRQQYEE